MARIRVTLALNPNLLYHDNCVCAFVSQTMPCSRNVLRSPKLVMNSVNTFHREGTLLQVEASVASAEYDRLFYRSFART